MDAIIVGGGIAGLCCAKHLMDAGKTFVILESSDRIGGRMATDEVDGFKLDRGFQVFLTSYPEAKRVLNYDALDLKPFEPGAIVMFKGKFERLSDPWRRPGRILATALSAAAGFMDKLKIASLRQFVARGDLAQLYRRPELPTCDALKRFGFSDVIIERFFRPFLGGIFLEPELQTSTRMFEFVFRMFSNGEATLPAGGMQAIPLQIASSLPPDSIRLNSRVNGISDQEVTLASGETLTAPAIILATANPEARTLANVEARGECGVTCVYFEANESPTKEAVLVLNGDGKGPVNNVCVPSDVTSTYAPAGKSLVSATVLGVKRDDATIVDDVRSQLVSWFGPAASEYRHLKTYVIPFALPSQTKLDPVEKESQLRPGLFRCGDDCDTASINGAMASGRRAAEAVLARR